MPSTRAQHDEGRPSNENGLISEHAHQVVIDQQLFAGTITSQIPYRQAVDLGYLPA
jgi:hypothetical protein